MLETPLHASIENQAVELRDAGGRLCGSYHYDDPYKSFLRGLYTPKGYDVVAPPPPDHPHHKGLQYGLCAEDVNFWEEDKDTEPGHRRIGRQVTEKLDLLTGGEIGFSQEIVWRDDICVSFHETRRISARPTISGYVWSWQTILTAARDVRLVLSAWPQNGGYCGLGLRLAPELFLKKSTVVLVPNQQRASGSIPESLMVRGTQAEVRFEQDLRLQQDVLYLQGCDASSGDDFAFVSLGPTNREPRTINKGESLKDSYVIAVADR